MARSGETVQYIFIGYVLTQRSKQNKKWIDGFIHKHQRSDNEKARKTNAVKIFKSTTFAANGFQNLQEKCILLKNLTKAVIKTVFILIIIRKQEIK